MRAHLELARLEARAGRPGAALRHFEIARRNDALTRADGDVLADLLVTRFGQRLAHGDGQAYRDIEAAISIAGDRIASTTLELRAEARFLAALAAFRRGNRWGRREGREHLARAGELAPSDPRLAARAPQDATPDSLAAAALWLYRGGALREAKDLLDRYASSGGGDAAALRAWVATRVWWGDDRTEPAVHRRLQDAGVSTCALATTAGDSLPSDCAAGLWSVAVGDRAQAALVAERAAVHGWRTSDATEAAAWAVIGLRGWLDGRTSWSGFVRQRCDVAGVAAAADLAPEAAATFLRLAGRPDQARAALDRAITAALDPKRAIAGEAAGYGLLLAAEAALVGTYPDDVVAALGARAINLAQNSAQNSALVEDLWLFAALRAGGQAEILAQAPGPAAAQRYWWRNPHALVGDESRRVEVTALMDVARGYLHDPAVADREAGDFVDGVAYIGRRGPMVAALFAAMGDSQRARAWAQRVVAANPRNPVHVFALAASVAAAGDATRAAVDFTAAAATSGDSGATSLQAARVLSATGHPLEAIAMGRRALAVTAPLGRAPVYRVVARAMTAMGRDGEAARARARAERLAPADRPLEPKNQPAGGVGEGPGDPSDVAMALARARAAGSPEAARAILLDAAAWNPDDERLYGELAQISRPGSAAHERAVTTLFALAIAPSLAPSAAVEPPAHRIARLERARRASGQLQRAIGDARDPAWRGLARRLAGRARAPGAK